MTYTNLSALRVLICDQVDSLLIEGLRRNGFTTIYEPEISHVELEHRVNDIEILVVRSRTKITEDILRAGKNLKIIARAGIGTDNIDMAFAKKAGVPIITAAGSSTASVAELNVALAIDLSRRIPLMDRNAKTLMLKKQTGIELNGKVAGIFGFGRIGRATAKILGALGMSILAYDIYHDAHSIEEVNGKYVEISRLMAESDYIFILATLTEGSVNFIDEHLLSMCKEGCFIINTSRAEIIDGEAMVKSMNSGRIAGYGMDVMWNDPPKELWEIELIKRDNVIVTPHIGAQTIEAQKRVAEFTLANLMKKLEEIKL